ncbi:MAG: hypothetical protein ACC642_10870, partial [Pseudomonadales bacterium]
IGIGRENMPEGLQEGNTGQMLQERSETCAGSADEIEGLDLDFTSELDEDDEPTDADREEEKSSWVMDQTSEISDLIGSCEI